MEENVILEGDCLEVMAGLADGSVDMVLTDPPYGTNKETGFVNGGCWNTQISYDFGAWNDAVPDMVSVCDHFHRLLKPCGTAVIWYDIWRITELRAALEGAGFKQIRLVEWIKTNPAPINQSLNYLTNCREVAVLGVKGGTPTFHSQYDNGIYNYPICRDEGRFHPTQKPVDLMRELVRKHSNPGDMVLDTFAGSGSTCVAAMLEGRRFQGIEIDGEYASRARDRIDDANRQGRMDI